MKDADTKHPMVRDSKYVSIKDFVSIENKFFPGTKEIRTRDGIGYALFEKSEYKVARKTLKRLLLHVVHVYPRLFADEVVRNKELLKTYGKMKTRTDTLGNAEKVNMEELLQSLERA